MCFFLWLSNTPLYMCHNFLIHSSVNGHLSCFHVLVIVYRAAMNIGVQLSFSVLVSSRYMPSSGIAGLFDGFIPSFLKQSPYCSPYWLFQFTFLSTVQEGSLFSTPSPAFVACRFFDNGNSDWCEVIYHCSFDLHFSNNE